MFGRRFRSSHIRKERQRVFFDRAALGAALLGALVLLFSQISMLRALNVDEVVVSGNRLVPARRVQQIASSYVAGYDLGLFSRANVALVRRAGIESALREEFPRIRSVHVATSNFTTLEVRISEREPAALSCNEGAATCFFVDRTGFIYARAPYFSGAPYLTLRGTKTPEIGTYALSTRAFSALTDFVEALGREGAVGAVLTIVNKTHYELTTKAGWRIVFDPTDDHTRLLENMRIVLASDDFKDTSRIEYVDLRFGNKIFFKLGGGE